MADKQLTFSQVKKDNKKYSDKERIYFNDGEFYLDVFHNFEPLKVKEMITEIGEVFKFSKENDIEIPDGLVFDFINCFIIKHFTSIPSPKDTKKLIAGFHDLINSDYYAEIMSAFNIDEVNKVFDKLFNGIETVGQFENKAKEINEELNN